LPVSTNSIAMSSIRVTPMLGENEVVRMITMENKAEKVLMNSIIRAGSLD